MAFTVVNGDPKTYQLTGAAGTEGQFSDDAVAKVFADKIGVVCRVLRGETDTDITALALRNEGGTEIFIYPNAAGNGVIVSSTAP